MNPKENPRRRAKEGDPSQLAQSFVARLNAFLADTDEEGASLQINPESYVPTFTGTIERMLAEGKSTGFHTVILTTSLELYDDLKAKKERWPSQYFVEESVHLSVLGEISQYMLDHSDVKARYLQLDLFDQPQGGNK
ncbi:MAG: hypothetical protein HY044_00545 [Candidatus Woesebacteria bacterium]|nr:MAG: hypothetical protein HY044_00545 [Candidatus Woesebacteria bacterium]